MVQTDLLGRGPPGLAGAFWKKRGSVHGAGGWRVLEQVVDPARPEPDALHASAHAEAVIGLVFGQAILAQRCQGVDEVMLDSHEFIDGEAEVRHSPVADLHDDDQTEEESVGLVQTGDGLVGLALLVGFVGHGEHDAVGVDGRLDFFQLDILDLLQHVVRRNFGDAIAVEVSGVDENHVLENQVSPLRLLQKLLDFCLDQHDLDPLFKCSLLSAN